MIKIVNCQKTNLFIITLKLKHIIKLTKVLNLDWIYDSNYKVSRTFIVSRLMTQISDGFKTDVKFCTDLLVMLSSIKELHHDSIVMFQPIDGKEMFSQV